jgi:hypothetical protein
MDEKAKLNKKKMTLSENYGSSIDLVRNDLENYYIGGVNPYGPEKKRAVPVFKLKETYEKSFEAPPDSALIIKGNQATYEIYKVETSLASPRLPAEEPLEITEFATKFKITTSDSFFNQLTSSMVGDQHIYEDSYMEIGTPIEYVSNVDNKSIIQGDVEFVYNYGHEKYEFLINDRQESKIPNFYEFPTGSSRGRLVRAARRGKQNVIDYILTHADYYDTTALQQERENFPFFNMISFGNPPMKTDDEELSDFIANQGLSALLCDVLNVVQSGFFGSTGSVPSITEGVMLSQNDYTGAGLFSSYKPDSNQTEFEETTSLFSENIQKYDLLFLIDRIERFIDFPDDPDPDDISDLEKTKSQIKKMRKVFGESEPNALDIQGVGIEGDVDEKIENLKEELQRIIDNYSRDFSDILAGDRPYCSDVLFYSIEKYEFGSSTPIQTFWVPAVYIYLGLDYIDTQIKYGKKYTYKIFAYKVTLDTEYSYDIEVAVSNVTFGFTSLILEYSKKVNPQTKILDGLARNLLEEFNKQFDYGEEKELGPKYPLMTNWFLTKSFNNDTLRDAIDQYIFDLEISTTNDTNFEVVNFARDILDGDTRTFATADFEYSVSKFDTEELNRLRAISDDWEKFYPKYQQFEKDLKEAKRYRSVFSALFPLFPWDKEEVENFIPEFVQALSNVGIVTNRSLIDMNHSQFGQTFTTAGKGREIRKSMTEALDNNDLLGFFLAKATEKSPSGTDVYKNDKITQDAIFWFAQAFEDDTLELLSDIASMMEDYNSLFSSIIPFKAEIDYTLPDRLLKATVRNYPKIVKIPYYEDSGAILDSPPMFPDTEFVSYKGKQNKINILLRSGQGSMEQNPISFDDSEQEYYELYRESRKLNDFEKIDYRSDEFGNIPTRFEIRRLAEAPKSYANFKDALVSFVDTPYGEDSFASSSSFLDNIEPNRKYYYIFRSIDRRGIFSNPTQIFQVEIVENSGAVYPLIEAYDIKQKDKITTKTLKRLFNIVPRLKQVLPDASDSLTMGTEKVSVFGKTFKLRMTSKTTGKVVDFNVEFVKEERVK